MPLADSQPRGEASSPELVTRAIARLEMARHESGRGRVRQHKDSRIYVDFGPAHRVWYFPVGEKSIRLTRDLADEVLRHVRGELGRGRELDQVLAEFQPRYARANLVETRLERWLDAKRREVAAGDRSPTYLSELERWARPAGHFSFWCGRSVLDVSYATLEDWSHWLADRALGAKTRWNVLAGFRSFLSWLYQRGELRELPRKYPWPRIDEHAPKIISAEAQDSILAAIPEARRGIFLAMALLGIRPSEAVALRVPDYEPGKSGDAGWLTVSRARKGRTLDAPVRGTKTRKVKRLPVPEELGTWIARHVPAECRLRRGLLFTLPYCGRGVRPAGPWSASSLRRAWESACRGVGVSVGLYEGTKHAMATDAIRRHVPERHVQALLGHADARSTRKYARLADDALIDAIRPRSRS